MVSLAEFRSEGYLVGSTVAPPEQTYGVGDPHHRSRKNNYYTHLVTNSQYPGLKKITVSTGGTDTVYLPYYQRQISSVHLPTAGPTFFVTDNMSGCAFFVARYTDGSLVVFHGNSQSGSDEATMGPAAVNHQTVAATNELTTLFNNARPHHPGAVLVRTLMKTEYLGAVATTHATGSQFLGGTTIAGWRSGTAWEFWYQNWGSVRGSATGPLFAKKFYPP